MLPFSQRLMKFAYADRSKYLADPDFFDVPVSQLISKKYGKAISKKINLNTDYALL